MSITEEVIARLRSLPPDKQRQALEYIESLLRETRQEPPRRDLRGLLAACNTDITEEDIAQARQEMWGRFRGGNT